MSLEIKPPFKAEARIYIFPREQLRVEDESSVWFEGKTVFVRRRGYVELQLKLAQAGLSPGQVMLFTHMVWRAGPTLERAISVSSLAKDLGRARQSVSKSITTLEKIGIIRRASDPSRLSSWDFPIHDEIMNRVRAWMDTKK